MIQIPTQELKEYGRIEHEGKTLQVIKEYTSGAAYKKSGDSHFMTSPKGVYGFREV